MSSSNSFNICPRCGNSNSLNAKYCSRCGAQLKIPTEAVVCHKCHTRNSSLANFCRNCGATLKVGAQTKICPRCGREIGAEENICACGYSFVTLQQTEPRRADVSSTNKDKKKDKKHDKGRNSQPVNNEVAATPAPEKSKGEKKPKPKKHGRGFAFFALIFLVLFVYAIIAPSVARPAALTNFDKGFYHYPKDTSSEQPSENPEDEGEETTAVVEIASQLFADGNEGDGDGEVATPTDEGENTTEPTTPTENGEGEGEGTDPIEPTNPTEPTDPTEGEDDDPVAETWTITFVNGTETVKTVTVTKGEKLAAEQIPAAPSVASDKEFKGWFNGETEITTDTVIDSDITVTAKIDDVQQTTPVDPNPTDPDPVDPNPVDPNPSDPNPGDPADGSNDGTNDTENVDNSENNASDDAEQEYIYGWSLIDLVVKFFKDPAQIEAMNNCTEGKVAYVMEQLGQGTFVVIAMLALFLLTAFLHLLVCIGRLISPKRSRHANLLYLILAIVTTLITIMMLCAHFLPEKEGFIGDVRNFFAPKYNGIDCAYGYALIIIPVYYWFFWLYSHIAKKAAPKKDKKS